MNLEEFRLSEMVLLTGWTWWQESLSVFTIKSNAISSSRIGLDLSYIEYVTSFLITTLVIFSVWKFSLLEISGNTVF